MEDKYPCIVNRFDPSERPTHYIGIAFNGDCGVYHKAVVKALKKAGSDKNKKLIKQVKASKKSDLKIGGLLIEANQFDLLVEVMGEDARWVVHNYIDCLYEKFEDSFKAKFPEKYLSSNLKSLEDLEIVDSKIYSEAEKVIKNLEQAKDEASDIRKQYLEALKRLTKNLKEEEENIEREHEKLSAIFDDEEEYISYLLSLK